MEYEKALNQIERLMSQPHLDRAESEMLELLSTLVEHYEAAEYPTPVGMARVRCVICLRRGK